MFLVREKSILWWVLRQPNNNRLSFWVVSFLILGRLWHHQLSLWKFFVELFALSVTLKLAKTSNTRGSITESKWSLEGMTLSSWCNISSCGWRSLVDQGIALLLEIWLPNLWLRGILLLSRPLGRLGWDVWLSFEALDWMLLHKNFVLILGILGFSSLDKIVSLDLVMIGELSNGPLLKWIMIYGFVHFAIFYINWIQWILVFNTNWSD